MGNSGNDFDFLIKKLDKKYQLLIAELPGHNNDKFNSKFSLINYANSIVLLILRNNLCDLVFFSHSVGGIIPILIAKQIKKKKIKKNFLIMKEILQNMILVRLQKKPQVII